MGNKLVAAVSNSVSPPTAAPTVTSETLAENKQHNKDILFSQLLHMDIWTYLFTHFLSYRDIVTLSITCTNFRELVEQPQVWKSLSETEWYGTILAKSPAEEPDTPNAWKKHFISCYKQMMSDLKEEQAEGYTPLQAACLLGYVREVERILTSGKEDVAALSECGSSPLYLACFSGCIETVKTLLRFGASVDQRTHDKRTPVYGAADTGHDEILSVLLSWCPHADVNQAEDTMNATPVYAAAFDGYYRSVKILLDANADINICTSEGHTPLFVAAQNGHKAVVELLIQGGAVINQANNNGATPLFMAAQEGHSEIVALLIQAGGALDTPRSDGATPLFMSAQNGHVEVVKVLLQAGADRSIRWKTTYTPLEIAQQQGHTQIVQLFETIL